jgi:exopolysaccharide biosynthesis WecB/TagA/CpsF family protein
MMAGTAESAFERLSQADDFIHVDAKRVIIGGIPVNPLSRAQWCDKLLADWRERSRQAGPPKILTTVNGQVMSLFGRDAQYHDALLAADGVAADGMSVVNAAARYAKSRLPERVATTDWFHDAAAMAQEHGLSFYIIGASLDTNLQAVAEIRRLYPRLIIAGHRDGYFNDSEIPQIARDVEAAGTDVLWLGIGNPRQLLIAFKLKPLLSRVTWIRTCGGLLDHISGTHKRAPAFLQQHGLEWAWRMALEPRRLFWRYLTTNIHAMYRMRAHTQKPDTSGSH